jgi:hypothetical protein
VPKQRDAGVGVSSQFIRDEQDHLDIPRVIANRWNLERTERVRTFVVLQTFAVNPTSKEVLMRNVFFGLLGTAAIAIATPVVPASAQVTVDTPVGGATIGPRHHYRDYDSPRYRPYARAGRCKTVTIHRDDGSMKRIQRCD